MAGIFPAVCGVAGRNLAGCAAVISDSGYDSAADLGSSDSWYTEFRYTRFFNSFTRNSDIDAIGIGHLE